MTARALLNGLLASSLSAGLLTLTALLLRAAFQHRTPRRLFCLLWDAAMLRLLILRPLPSPLSVWRLSAFAAAPGAGTGGAPGLAAFGGGAAGGAALPGGAGEWGGAASAAPAAALPLPPAALLAALWLAGALALAVWFCRGHLRGLGRYADALPCTDPFVRGWLACCGLRRRVRVCTSDRIAAPLTYGVLRPVILLPSGPRWPGRAALPYVLQHEIEHIRRFDTLRKALFAAALCLHWFDPLAWLLFAVSGRETELACDEAVIAQGADPAGYALALLRMEERRGGWGLAGSHFSQNVLEERIQAMIKHKKASLAAAVAVVAAMSVTATVFASPAPAGTEPPVGQNPPETAVYDHAQAVEGEVLILSKGGEDGEKLYSVDGGKTWLTEADYRAQYGGSDWQVEWWTAEDYAAWLEEEKQALQSMIGERGYTGGEGWFTWDQQRVDEAIALYEGILEQIKNGALFSKSITDPNGEVLEDVALGSGSLTLAQTMTTEQEKMAVPQPVDEAALLEELKAFGVAGDADRLTFRGQLVRSLVDGVSAGESGYSIRYAYQNPDGVLDLHTLRAVRFQPDGSYDPMGEMIGLAAAGDPGFDQGLIDAAVPGSAAPAAYAEGSGGEGGRSFEEIFAQYQPYGLTYTPGESGRGSLSWKGQPVRSFADQTPGGGVFSFEDPAAQGGLCLRTEYDASGRLTGLRAE